MKIQSINLWFNFWNYIFNSGFRVISCYYMQKMAHYLENMQFP